MTRLASRPVASLLATVLLLSLFPAAVFAASPTADAQSVSTKEETPLLVTLTGSDPDGDALGFTVTAPGNGNLGSVGVPNCTVDIPSVCTATVTYTPNATFVGPDSFDFTVDDGTSQASNTISIDVTPVNHAPIAAPDTANLNEDSTAHFIDVLANDTDPDPGDTALLTVTAATNPPHGTVVVAPDGSGLTYKPDPNYHGSDTFGYTVSDTHGGTDTGTVTVAVASVNDPPDGTDNVIVTNEDTPYAFTPADFGFKDPFDTAPANTLFAVRIASLPLAGSLQDNGANVTSGQIIPLADLNAGNLTFTPAPNANGTGYASFDFQVQDNGGTSNGGIDLDPTPNTISIDVTPVNDPPVAGDDVGTVAINGPATSISVLANDSDVDVGDILTITSKTNGSKGVVAIASDKLSLTYQPYHGFSGVDSFTYTISDGTTTATATVTIHINGANRPPNAVPDVGMSVREGAGPTILDVLANDDDPDGDTFRIVSATNGAHGTVRVAAGGAWLTYDPASLFHGTDTFTYTIHDSTTGSDTATVVVTVVRDHAAPIVVAPYERFMGQTVGTSTIKSRIAWSASDTGSGIKSYQLQVSVNGHTFATVALAHATSTYADRVLSGSSTYRFRVRATDREGNVSAWRYGPTFRAGQYQESTSLAAFTGSWSTHKTASALGGAVKVGYSPAASARFHATAYDFGLVVTKSTTGGQADIYVDGVLAGRISLHATRTTYRQLVFARHFATLGSHTIEVRPVGNGRVDVDAFTVLR